MKAKLAELVQRLLKNPPETLTRVACYFALAGLFALSFSVLWPKPLSVVIVMGVGEVLGIGAFACYLLAVLVDYQRSRPRHSLPHAVAVTAAPSPSDETSKE